MLTLRVRAFCCKMDITAYVDSNEWRLLECSGRKNVHRYPCCEEPFPDLTYTIRVKRIAVFYSFILVLPCVLLSLLTLVSFWLPAESPAKVLLGLYTIWLFVCTLCMILQLLRCAGPLKANLGPRGNYRHSQGPLQAALPPRDRGAPPTLRGPG